MFEGLSAFALTPMTESGIDEASFSGIVSRLATSGVDSICALGSTGSYAYLTTEERARVARLAVDAAGDTPLMIGIGALRTSEVLALAADAQAAGASAVLLAPVSYQQLTEDEVLGLYDTVTHELSVPLCVYDNPGTTHFTFTDELHARISELPNVGSIKIPGVPSDPNDAAARVDSLRRRIAEGTTIGVSGDTFGAVGLGAGCEVWYSVLAGTLPAPCVEITRAAQRGDRSEAQRLSGELLGIWDMFRDYGSVRVVAAIAEELGLVGPTSLPLPLRSLPASARGRVTQALSSL